MPDNVDEILWGGPKGPGLVFTVQHLSEAVTRLSTIVSDPHSGLMRGFDAHTTEITDLTRDVSEIKSLIKKAIYALALVGIIALVPAVHAAITVLRP